MAIELASTFAAGIASAQQKIEQVNEASAGGRWRPGGWTCKEILGHLIDSALNNHQRFVRASLDDSYEGPSYEQNGWVAMHGYGQLSWTDLRAHWKYQNVLLCAVVAQIPEDKYGAACRVGSDEPVTLRFLVEDYLVHLHHHAGQIAAVVSPGQLFVNYSIEKIQQTAAQVKECMQGLSDEHVWHRSGDNANSIGNLVLHLAGNVRQWIGHGIGGLADVRERDKEFSARGGRSAAEILILFEETIADALQFIKQMPLERLTERIKPQNREVAILEAIYQVVGHLQLHTGQIIFATKQFTGMDMHFFKG